MTDKPRRRVSDEPLASAAEDHARLVEQGDAMRAALVELEAGIEDGDRLDAAEVPSVLRDRASLVIRCNSCRGLVVACALYVRGRPLMWARQSHGGAGSWGFVDDGFWGDVAHCRSREYVLEASVILAALPGPGQLAAPEIRLDH